MFNLIILSDDQIDIIDKFIGGNLDHSELFHDLLEGFIIGDI